MELDYHRDENKIELDMMAAQREHDRQLIEAGFDDFRKGLTVPNDDLFFAWTRKATR